MNDELLLDMPEAIPRGAGAGAGAEGASERKEKALLDAAGVGAGALESKKLNALALEAGAA